MARSSTHVEAEQARSAAAVAPMELSEMTTLVLDDKFDVGESSCGKVSNLGIRKMILVTSPEQGESELLVRKFRLLVADDDCSKENAGLEFIKNHRNEFDAMVLHTGRYDIDKIRRANALGAELLAKPASLDQFREAIEKAFRRKAANIDTGTPGG